MADHLAAAEIEINATGARVWAALTDPQLIKRYMFGAHVVTDWHQGSTIVWEGEYDGQVYQDKGQILEIEPERRLRVTHFSPLSGQQDVPESYHTLLYELTANGDKTRLSLSQNKNASADEALRAKGNWEMMLRSLKEVVEGG